jgi:DNA-binding CsgD family transcriptional regulator
MRSVVYEELITSWLDIRRILYIDFLHRQKFQFHLNTEVESMVGNVVFDAIIKDQNHLGCFYFFTDIEESLLRKCQMMMKLLLTCVYDTLTQLPGKPTARECQVVGLTGREQEIIARIRAGLNNKSIARQLNISVNTVKSHIYNIFQKLQASNRVEALLKAQQAGYLT